MVVVPHHYYNCFLEEDRMLVTAGGYSEPVDVKSLNHIHYPEDDITVFFLPIHFPMFPNITNRFISENDVPNIHTKVTLWLTSLGFPTRELYI